MEGDELVNGVDEDANSDQAPMSPSAESQSTPQEDHEVSGQIRVRLNHLSSNHDELRGEENGFQSSKSVKPDTVSSDQGTVQGHLQDPSQIKRQKITD